MHSTVKSRTVIFWHLYCSLIRKCPLYFICALCTITFWLSQLRGMLSKTTPTGLLTVLAPCTMIRSYWMVPNFRHLMIMAFNFSNTIYSLSDTKKVYYYIRRYCLWGFDGICTKPVTFFVITYIALWNSSFIESVCFLPGIISRLQFMWRLTLR